MVEKCGSLKRPLARKRDGTIGIMESSVLLINNSLEIIKIGTITLSRKRNRQPPRK